MQIETIQPTALCSGQTHYISYDATFLHILVYSRIKLTPGKLAMQVLTIKYLVKDAQLSQCGYDNVARINEYIIKSFYFERPGCLTPLLSNKPMIHE